MSAGESATPEASQQLGNRVQVDWWLVAILVVAALWRLEGILDRDVWLDEANAIIIAQAPLSDLRSTLALDSSPGLFFLMLRAWMTVFGDGALAVRTLSLVGGVMLVGCVYSVGRALYSRAVGMWSSGVMALLPVQVFHSQQVRPYTWLALLALLSVGSLILHLRGGARRHLVVSGLATVLAMHLHASALFLPLAHLTLIALTKESFAKWRTWAAFFGAILVGYAPSIPTLLAQLRSEHYSFFGPLWEAMGPLGALWRSALAYSPAGEYLLYAPFAGPSRWSGIPALAFVVVACWGARSAFRSRAGGTLASRVWLVVAVAVPALVACAASTLGTPHYVPSRVDQLFAGPFALLVGLGASNLRHLALKLTLGLLLAAGTVDFKRQWASTDAPSDGAAVSALATLWQPNDAVLCTSLTRAALQYGLGNVVPPSRFVSFPVEAASHLGNIDAKALLGDPRKLAIATVESLRASSELTGPKGRTFLVLTADPANAMLQVEPLERATGSAPTTTLGPFAQAGTGSPYVVNVYREGGLVLRKTTPTRRP